MHTQTHPLTHKHFVAAPLFLLCAFTAFFVLGALQLSDLFLAGSILDEGMQKPDNLIVHQQSAISGLVSEGTILGTEGEVVSLKEGTLMIAGESLVPLQVHHFSLLGLNGAYSVSATSSKFTIAALTSPVVLLQNDTVAIIPIGYQWELRGRSLPGSQSGIDQWLKARMVQPIPTPYLKRQYERTQQLSMHMPSVAPPPYRSLPSENKPVWLLPEAQKRKAAVSIKQTVGYLRYIAERDDIAHLEQVLQSPIISDVRRIEGRVLLGGVLRNLTQVSPAWLPLQRLFLEEDAVWLLAAFHPAFRDAAGALNNDYRHMEMRLLYTYFYPLSDTLQEESSNFVFDQWQQEVETIAKQIADPSLYITPLLQTTMPMVREFDTTGYPHRSQRLLNALRTIADEHSEVLLQETLELLARLELESDTVLSFDSALLLPESAAEVPETLVEDVVTKEEVQEEVVLPEREVVDRARQLLSEAGALFSTKTTVIADRNRARVEGLLIPHSNGKALEFALDIDVVAQTVLRILHNGQQYPNEVSLQGFIQWAKNL